MGNVVITGGSRGIGAATVELFAARGDRVTFLYEKNHTAAKAVADKTGAAAILLRRGGRGSREPGVFSNRGRGYSCLQRRDDVLWTFVPDGGG